MIEHRLIEKVITMMEQKVLSVEYTGEIDPDLIQDVTHFIRLYTDQCQHGKEEDILFKELKNKNISREHDMIIGQLIEYHKLSRKTTGDLVASNEKYRKGDGNGFPEIMAKLKDLIEVYPEHIMKEDRQFFIQVMEYFTWEKKDAMLGEGYALDSRLLHEVYAETISDMEKRLKS